MMRILDFLTTISSIPSIHLLIEQQERVKLEASLFTILSLSQLKYQNISVAIKLKVLDLVRNLITLRSPKG